MSERLKLAVTFPTIPASLTDEFRQHFPNYIEGLIRSEPGGFVYFPEYGRHAENIYNMKPRPDDVFVMTFPKSGTTWVQEMAWLIVNDCNFRGAKTYLYERSPHLEGAHFLSKPLVEKYEKMALIRNLKMPLMSTLLDVLNYCHVTPILHRFFKSIFTFFWGNQVRELHEIERMKTARILKTHLPLYLLHPQVLDVSKVIYVARNPKDVIVSYFHFHKLIDFFKFNGDLNQFADYFIKDQVFGSPYFPHVLDAWEKRHHPNLHFVFYEDLKRNLKGEVNKMATFLGKSLTPEQVDQLAKHLRIDSFAKNEAVNNEIAKDIGFMNPEGHFIRKGKTGDWKNHFSPELNERIDQWMKKHLAGTDLCFTTELDVQD